MIRILTFVFGLFGAASISQFPEFSQQYLQRLAGAVDELTRVVADFDASAEGVGLTREAALASLTDGEFQQARREDMTRTIARAERLGADLEALRAAPVALRALQPYRFTDREIAAAAWADFKPAVPVTPVGLGFAGGGFLAGMLLGWPLLRGLGWPLRALLRRRGKRQTARHDPPPLTGADGGVARPGLPIGWLARTNTAPHKIVQQGGRMQVAVLALAAGERRAARAGAACDTVLMSAAGAGHVEQSGVRRGFETGQLVMLPPGASYVLGNEGSDELRVIVIEQLGLEA